MNKYLSIFLLSIYLITITELCQLIKLPFLVEHFYEHKTKNNKLSLIDFLIIHYAQEDDHDGDEDKEMKLPFKSHDGCINAIASQFIPSSFSFSPSKSRLTLLHDYSTYVDQFLTSPHLSSIWQPPKSC